MGKFLIRDDYYQMIFEILELERISVGDYLNNKYEEFRHQNPHFVEILYKDIFVVLEGVLKEGEGDLVIENGDFAVGYDDFITNGPVNNLHVVINGLHELLVSKMSENIISPAAIIEKLERFEQKYLTSDHNTPEYAKKLKDLNKRIKGWHAPVSKTDIRNKVRKRIPKENKVRAELQKDIGSICPFCTSTEVGHFEIHHIDENPSNNDNGNLLLLCPTCHSRVTKGDISHDEVLFAKANPKGRDLKVEFVSAHIDSEQCSWVSTDLPNVFYNSSSAKSQLPLIGFTIINHTDKTVVLKVIKAAVIQLQSGLSGLPQAAVLKSLNRYSFCLSGAQNKYSLINPLHLPTGASAKFDVELYEQIVNNEIVAPQGRMVVEFVFEFSNNITLIVPKIFLNCKSENDPLTIGYLS